MAKQTRQNQKILNDEYNSLDNQASVWRKINAEKEKGLKYDERALKYFEQTYGSITNLEKKIDDIFDTWSDFTDEVEKSNKKIKDTLNNFDDIDDTLTSIGNQIGKNNKLYNTFSTKLDSAKNYMQSISNILQTSNDLSETQVDNALEASKAYQNMNISIAKGSKELMRGKITQSQFNDLVKESYESFDDLVSKIDDSTESGKRLLQVLQAAKDEMKEFEVAAKRSQNTLDAMGTAMDQFNGVPMMREFGNVIKSASEGGGGLVLAMGAMGAAAGVLAYELGFVGDKLKDVAGFDKQLVGLNEKVDLAKNKIAGAFAGERAAGDFGFQMQQMAVAFQAASKTALFGKGLGSVGYGAGQLQLAGISAETIASQMSSASDATGRMPSAKVAADMSILAARTGQSAEGIASINEMFMRVDGSSEATALNMQEGLRAMADQAKINLGGLMAEIAESSKEMLGYQIKSGSALARQVTFARSMGVSFQDIAKAGQSMVLNYKDSIKSEMQLSAMLGKNVDLSEVRASFASGDTEGALKALQAQGLDPAKMDMFQQQMLQQATGMDLTTLSKIGKNTGRTGTLGAGNATAGNQGFLGAKQSAAAGEAIANANIAVQQAAFNIKMDAKVESAIQSAIMDNSENLKNLLLEVKQKEAEKQATIAAKEGTFGLAGAGIGAGLGYLGNKAMGLFKGGPGTTAAEAGKSVASTAGKTTFGTAAKGIGSKLGGITAAGLAGYEEWQDNKSKGIGTGENVARTATTATGAGLGAWGGAAAGAAIGSVVPVVGTLIGGLIGGAIGAWGGKSIAQAGNDAVFGDKNAKVPATAPAPAAVAAATPGNTSVATATSDMNKLLEKIAFSTNETVKGNNKLFTTTNNAVINGNTQIAELRILNTNTLAMKDLTRKIEALTRATYEGGTTVKIDGKILATAATKYQDNTTGMSGTTSTKTTYG